MVSHPETGSDSPIGSDQDRGRDTYHSTLSLRDNHVRVFFISGNITLWLTLRVSFIHT